MTADTPPPSAPDKSDKDDKNDHRPPQGATHKVAPYADVWLFDRPNPSKLTPFGGPRNPGSDQDHSERCAQAAGRYAIDAGCY